ncbi:unnamed protein product [Trichobilharzia regenti]|nr:unnamed protein product [Trichobilharzia regenti]
MESVCGISTIDRELEMESLSLPSSASSLRDSSSFTSTTTSCDQSTMECNSNNCSKSLGKRKRTDEDNQYSSNDNILLENVPRKLRYNLGTDDVGVKNNSLM